MRRQHQIKEFAILSPCVVIGLLWLWSKTRPGGWDITVGQGLTQIVSLISFQLFGIVLLIAARSRTIERIYGGLDRSYGTHGILARVAFVLMVLHPVLLVPDYVARGEFWKLWVFADFWPRNVGITSFYLFVILVALTLVRKLEYQAWLTSHKLFGVPYVLGGVHALNANSDVKAFEPLRDWVMFWLILGTMAWLYKIFLYERFAKQYGYVVERVDKKEGGIWDFVLRPVRARMSYEPGEFAFLSVRGNPQISPEPHPFTIASDPAKFRLRFGVRETGDYTRSLQHLKEGDEVRVFGPYGEFTSYNFDAMKRQVWIGGGIGITPFLSMLSHERSNEDGKHVWLYYNVKTASDAAYDPDVRESLAGHEDLVRYYLVATDQDGFLTAQRIRDDLGGDLTNTLFLMCGPPPMMHAIKKQLLALGVPAAHIEFEEFAFV